MGIKERVVEALVETDSPENVSIQQAFRRRVDHMLLKVGRVTVTGPKGGAGADFKKPTFWVENED